jgi:hypothetical protein
MGEIKNKNIAVSFDVDLIDYHSDDSFDELDETFYLFKSVFEKYKQVKTTWYMRIDDHMGEVYGEPDYLFKRHKDKIEWLNSNGHEIGLLNLAGYVEIGGLLFVSFPIGKPRVEFNSQRVLSPDWPVLLLNNFQLIEFVLIPWKGAPIHGLTPEQVDRNRFGQAGLYKFKKISD